MLAIAVVNTSCHDWYTKPETEAVARHVFEGSRDVSNQDRRRLGQMEACRRNPGDRKQVVEYDRHQAHLWHERVIAAAQRAMQERLRAIQESKAAATPLPPSPAPTPVPAPATSTSTTSYAIPSYVVQCESGGDPTAVSPFTGGGLYGILSSSWAAFGGTEFAPEPYDATPAQQSIVAQRILAAQGPSAWSCWK